MATTLFSGVLPIPAGLTSRAPNSIPSALKRAGVAQKIHLVMDGSAFPPGVTTITIGISTDGGLTFRTASMTCNGPRVVPPRFSSDYEMVYELDSDAAPTHAQVTIDAPQAFSAQTLVEVLS